jgi:hypothetical protein
VNTIDIGIGTVLLIETFNNFGYATDYLKEKIRRPINKNNSQLIRAIRQNFFKIVHFPSTKP